MRNLHVVDKNVVKFGQTDLPLTATAFDVATNDVICALGPSPAKPVIELKRCKSSLQPGDAETTTITSWDAPCPLPDLECDSILSLQYLHDSAEICLVLAGGDLVLVREKPRHDQERIEIVGSIDIGIYAAQWSWDASLLAVVTRAGAFVLMSKQLEPITETTLQGNDLNLSKHVSVGWGKKETQFQGKRAKALKDPTMPEFVDEGKPSPHDDGSTTISWRGDGAYVAINSPVASNRRVIRVYSAEGVLDSVSEPVDGLEAALSWRPHGNVIAGMKRTIADSPKLEVIFFERNGLRHGEFDLRLSEEEMNSFGSHLSLAWNQDSSILAVSLKDRIQLWTVSNYHYSLKQEYRLKDVSFIWHQQNPLRFSAHSPQILQSAVLEYRVDRGSMSQPFDHGVIAVIDGKTLKLTPLKHANTPPPMAFAQVQADNNIVSCAISRTCQRVAFITYKHLYLCTWEMQQAGKKSNAAIRHSSNLRIQKKDLAMFPHPTQVALENDDAVLLLDPAVSNIDPQARCYKYTWVNTVTENPALMTQNVEIPLDTRSLIVDAKHESLWLRTSKDIISSELYEETHFPAISATSIVKVHSLDVEETYAVSLKDHQLVIDGKACANQVTSFAVTDNHIVYSASNHLLKFIHLRTKSDGFQIPGDTPEVDERCRAVERGSLIVTVIPSIYAVVLQMPRGNLETIYPRILVLAGIRKHIADLSYKEAFLACRTHQVDLNILYDYDPMLWSANVDKFLDQLKKPGRIDEFIQKLKGENVTETLYRDTSTREATANGNTRTLKTDKVNSICTALIEALATRPAEYQQNIVTAHICKQPPDTKSALLLVSSLRQTSQEEADLAVSHLCFLSDPSRLYDAALGLYDLELTLLVAQNAQRDPREYMPFLQSLYTLPELRRKYTIDNYLKRYSSALTYLHALEAHDELEAYTVKHNLYAVAESLYVNSPTHLSRIIRLHADHLASTSQPLQAAILYESLNDQSSAYPLYALAHHWRESLTCASMVPLQPSQLTDLATSLASSIRETNRDYRAAATIHTDYLNDPLTAATLLCKASYFADATRLLSLPTYNLSSEIPAIIDPALTRKFGEIIELIADCTTQLSSQVPRVEELRTKKEADPLAFYGGDTLENGTDFPDNVSLAPTDASTLGGQSMFTRYGAGAGGSQASTKFAGTVRSDMSRRTSKTRRREERKRARGKKGSVYEEEYLVASVGRLIERVNGTHEEVRRLVMGLRRRGMRELARTVESAMEEIGMLCADAKGRVWVEVTDGVGVRAGVNGYAVDGEAPSADVNDGNTEVQDGVTKPAPEVKVWNAVI